MEQNSLQSGSDLLHFVLNPPAWGADPRRECDLARICGWEGWRLADFGEILQGVLEDGNDVEPLLPHER